MFSSNASHIPSREAVRHSNPSSPLHHTWHSRHSNPGVDPQQQLTEVFRLFDTDRSGYITHDELRNVMLSLGQPLSDAQLRAMIKQVMWCFFFCLGLPTVLHHSNVVLARAPHRFCLTSGTGLARESGRTIVHTEVYCFLINLVFFALILYWYFPHFPGGLGWRWEDKFEGVCKDNDSCGTTFFWEAFI